MHIYSVRMNNMPIVVIENLLESATLTSTKIINISSCLCSIYSRNFSKNAENKRVLETKM